MGASSKIAWTDSTWNVISGCSRVSEGCTHCYAEALSHRYGWTTAPWTTIHAPENVQFHPDRLDQVLRWRKPRRIFVNSMSDLWHDQVSDEILDPIWATMALAPHHTFQILTKQPQRMQQYLTNPTTPSRMAALVHALAITPEQKALAITLQTALPWPLPHVWLGISCETQVRADERIPWLIETPAAVRFLSCEPLLGPIDLRSWIGPSCRHPDQEEGETDDRAILQTFGYSPTKMGLVLPHRPIDWVIVGAESGPQARPMDDAWVRILRDQCHATRIAFFMNSPAT